MTKIKTRCGTKEILVDDALAPFLSLFNWCLVKSGKNHYAITTIDGFRVLMHRLILNPPLGMHVDHIDNNGLNNTLQNLRPCTKRENGFNRPLRDKKYLGVITRRTRKGLVFCAVTNAGGSTQNHGIFKTEKEAALARDAAALELWGQYAKLNFPKGAK